MLRVVLCCALCAAATPGWAEQLVAARTIRAQTVLAAEDVKVEPGTRAGTFTEPAEVVGLETRVTLYAGRPIRINDLGKPAIVERNQFLPLIFLKGGLTIRTEGRALERAGIGETIRVMNAASRATVNARLAKDGAAYVTQ